MNSCDCDFTQRTPKLVVLTGGPGAGKTAVLELVQREYCPHVVVLPEAAGVAFRGGFPRKKTLAARKSAQRAIYHLQSELERMTVEEGRAAVALCDRGTLDALAYWPGAPEEFLTELRTSLDAELARYATVIHLRTPPPGGGYDYRNPDRVETPQEAAAIDERILEAWAAHPRRFFVPSTVDFIEKARQALGLIHQELPECCRRHAVSGGYASNAGSSGF